MNWLVDFASSGGIGAFVGFLGGSVSKWIEHKDKKAERAYELKKMEISLREAKLESDHELEMANKQIERAQVEGDLKVESEEVAGWAESQKSIGKLHGLLRLVRPGITAYMLVAYTVFHFIIWDRVDGLAAFSQEELNHLLEDMVRTLTFLTVTCTAWWFGSRGGNIKQ